MSRKPCHDCPFIRTTEPGELGGSSPFVYIGQAFGPFLLPCHNSPGYEEDKRDPDHLQCVGAAIFRANCDVADKMPPQLLRMEKDSVLVFGSPAEFVAHHQEVAVEFAAYVLSAHTTPERLVAAEMRRAGVKFYKPSQVQPK